MGWQLTIWHQPKIYNQAIPLNILGNEENYFNKRTYLGRTLA